MKNYLIILLAIASTNSFAMESDTKEFTSRVAAKYGLGPNENSNLITQKKQGASNLFLCLIICCELCDTCCKKPSHSFPDSDYPSHDESGYSD